MLFIYCIIKSLFSWGRWTTYQQKLFGSNVSGTELEEMARSVMMYCLKYYNGDDKIKVSALHATAASQQHVKIIIETQYFADEFITRLD